MRIFILASALVSIFFLSSCDPSSKEEQKTSPDVPVADTIKRAYIPVTEIIRGEIAKLNNEPVSPLYTKTVAGKTDSTWIKNNEIGNYATPFFQPVIDSVHIAPYYSERSFQDQTVNAFTFTYEPIGELPDSMPLKNWDVFVNPQTNEVSRVYMVKKTNKDGQQITEQLTWKSGEYFKITTILEQAGKEPVITEEQVTWKF